MTEHILLGLMAVVFLGVGAQWLAWRFNFPSIILLLLMGFAAGPVTGFLDPDALLHHLLTPFISISVAVILFEGGLSLRFSELRDIGKAVRNLITIGMVVTWLGGAFAAYMIFDLTITIALLLGAVLVVSGPTVVGPLLEHIRPDKRLNSILKWESILIDPIGALLAVLVFDFIVETEVYAATTQVISGLIMTFLLGGAFGILGAILLILFLRRFWIPDYLSNAFTLMTLLASFVASEMVHDESGLVAATIMGIVLANQKTVEIRDIVKFKEELRLLLISTLFILLAARLNMEDLTRLKFNSLAFLAVLILLIRPISVLISTFRTPLNWREKMFLSWMMPRGIVAAAVASIFALKLEKNGYQGVEDLLPLTFVVIVGTVVVYGLTASSLAKLLKVAQPDPSGVMFVGAHECIRQIAHAIQNEGFHVILVDTNRSHVTNSQLEGLTAHYGSILSDPLMPGGVGKLIAMTPNDELNSLASLHFRDAFGRSNVFQLIPEHEKTRSHNKMMTRYLHGRYIFDSRMTYSFLYEKWIRGSAIKRTLITEKFTFEDFRVMYGRFSIPLFLVDTENKLQVFTIDDPPKPMPGHTIIHLVDNSALENSHPQH